MGNNKQKRTTERMIHVRLPESVHKKVRISAAETDQTIQDWVFGTIKRELERQELS
jgi:predicted HicB family RNase H-like nuclease